MVKIPKRLSRNSNGMQGIRNHLDYISRNGKTTVENHSGEKLNGKKAVKSQLDDWQNLIEKQQHDGEIQHYRYNADNQLTELPFISREQRLKNRVK